ncbi:30S ribosomal protein S3 [Bienertia sinuspersici]
MSMVNLLVQMMLHNKANRQVGKEKNFMHTSGPRSFARFPYKWKKDRKTTQDPSPIQMLIATRKEKLTKRKPGDLRDKMISELQELDSEKDVDTVISNIVGSDNKKKCRFNLHGKGVSSTQLKQNDIMKKVKEKHAN